MLKEIFHDSFENFEITRIWNHASVTVLQNLVQQMLPTFGGRCNRHFWDIRLKILRLTIFNMLFQLVLTKFFKRELFSCLPKVNHVIKSCKEPIGTGTPDFAPFSLQVYNIILYFLVKFLTFSSFFQELPCKSKHQKQWNNFKISLIYHRRFVNRC